MRFLALSVGGLEQPARDAVVLQALLRERALDDFAHNDRGAQAPLSLELVGGTFLLVFDENGNDFPLGHGSPRHSAAGPITLLGAYSSPDIGLFRAANVLEPTLTPLADVTRDHETLLTFKAGMNETNLPSKILDLPCRQGSEWGSN